MLSLLLFLILGCIIGYVVVIMLGGIIELIQDIIGFFF